MKDYNFQKLTPINNIENMGVYASALDFVFENDDLRNIAVTGPYGAGKSSMIETYKTKSEYRFLHISLAHFEKTKESPDNAATEEARLDTEKVLEGKILNQLLHQIDPQDIEQTNFKIKKQISGEDVKERAFYITLFFLIAMYLGRFGAWRELLLEWPDSFIRDILFITLSPYTVILAGCIFGILFLGGAYKIIHLQKTRNIFKKLKFEGNELELFEECKDSYFDKYLNEVLYLFENARADVIVFEDIDRFDMVGIFERLREINRLINKRRDREGKTVIRFFYLLRDDIFTSKDRTKFFDYIIPVIPVLNGSNAREKFGYFFKKAGILREFDPVFLRDVSLYIDEMRTLQNIYNEYMVYSQKINFIGLDPNKLLAMVIYKNIFPKDFHDLHLRQGYVNQVFDKDSCIQDQKKEQEKKLRECQKEAEKEIQRLSEEKMRDLDEVDALFFDFNQGKLRIGGKEKSTYNSNAQILHAMKENPLDITYYYEDYYNRGEWRKYPFEEEYKKLSQNPEYVKRKRQVEEKTAGRIGLLREQIAEAEEKIKNLDLLKIRELATRRELEEITYRDPTGGEEAYDNIKKSPYFRLLQYLLLNGWIDEAYPDYISYFYEGSISRQEKEFLLAIADRKAKPYSFEMRPSLELLNNLDIRDFSRKEILNFSLLELLMENRVGYQAFYHAFLEFLKDTDNIKFVMGFYQYTKYQKCFMQELYAFWPEIVGEILEEEGISFEEKKPYLIDTIIVSVEKDLEEESGESCLHVLNEDSCITEFISAHEDFIRIQDSDEGEVLCGYEVLQVKFETWVYDEAYKKMSRGVYERKQYLFSKENIEAVCKAYLLEGEETWAWEDAATRILSREQEPICRYVRENMDLFLYFIFENAKGVLRDREDICLLIFNDESVSMEKRKSYLAQTETVITHLKDIQEVGLWDVVLECKAAAYTEENILTYYFKGGLQWTDTLIGFINGGIGKLNFRSFGKNESYGENAESIFWNCVIFCKEISDEKYEEILSSMGRYYNKFSKQDLPESKMEILIRTHIIHMTADTLLSIRTNYPSQAVYFAKMNITEYIKLLTEGLFSMEELLALLEEGDIHVNHKKKLLDKTKEAVTVVGKKYPLSVRRKILEEHFDSGDLKTLILDYDKENAEIQEIIVQKAAFYIKEILSKEYPVARPLLLRLLEDEKLEFSHRQLLFSQNLIGFSREETIVFLKQLKLTQFLPVFEGKNPRVKKTTAADYLLPAFQRKGWVGKVKKEEMDGGLFYRIHSKERKAKRKDHTK